jgi:hypothetical protein
MAIIAPLESPSLLDPSPGELERAEVVGDNIMVSVDFNADVASSLVTTGLDQVGFVPIGKIIYHALFSFRLQIIDYCIWYMHGDMDMKELFLFTRDQLSILTKNRFIKFLRWALIICAPIANIVLTIQRHSANLGLF